jgi:chaperonin GroES
MTTYMQTVSEMKQQDTKELKLLKKYRSMINIADDKDGAGLDDGTMASIGSYLLTGISSDESDREPWLERYDSAIDNAMQKKSTKNYPFNNAANVKYPLIASASQQFHARAYGAIIKGNDIVKAKVIKDTPDNQIQKIADVVAAHMSDQLLEVMPGWVDGLDKTLGILPTVGCVFKKTYRSQIKNENVSEYVTAKDVIIKYDSVNVEDAPRVTHPQSYTKNEIISFVRSGQWRECALDIYANDNNDTQDVYHYYECHAWYDLDNDDYAEPYIITMEKETGKVVRIVARYDMADISVNSKGEIIRIKAIDYFTRYIFLQSPDGGVYGMGFGTLLGPINDAVNTLINQLVDSGTLNNTGGGFVSSKLKMGQKRQSTMGFKQNEWKIVDFGGQNVKDAILPLPVKEPSGTLFSLLGMMISAGKELSSVTELMTGESRGSNESPTTVMALIEQGTMVFTAIYKRIYQALKSEFKKIYRLNRIHLATDEENRELAEYYRNERFNIIPIADPQDATDMQKVARASALMQIKNQGLNDAEINKRYLDALSIEDTAKILEQPPQPPNPVLVIEEKKQQNEQIKLNLATDKQMLERSKFEYDVMKGKIDIMKTISETIKNLAEAEAKEVGTQLEQYKQQAELLLTQFGGFDGSSNNGSVGSFPTEPANKVGDIGNQGQTAGNMQPVL